jgi:hypothetical protein
MCLTLKSLKYSKVSYFYAKLTLSPTKVLKLLHKLCSCLHALFFVPRKIARKK